ncbi:MAG: hydantoinase/oxoprolinase family protein [Alphaproteobacteria bacterium]|nr:hydantoinase/oxoprolinase family protein [Alphaproteobacteria bacterium]
MAERAASAGAAWRVGVDIGGTFTDVVAIRAESNETRIAKVATRPGDRVNGLFDALAAVGLEWAEVGDLIHGTTMVTNAIIEGRLAKVALVTTRGFADTLAIGRQNRRDLYRLDVLPKLLPLVPRERCLEVDERLDADGRVLKPLSEADADDAVDKAEKSGAEAVAVSLIHAYANPAHEERLGERLRRRFPYVALSNRVNPEAREYERTATTVLSASVMPLAAGYLDDLARRVPAGARIHLFHSAGGMASAEALRDLPLGLAMSGPAAGVAAAARIARELDLDHVISFDMGGTTTDACLIADGRPEIATDRTLAGRPLRQPMVAVESIGAGGGSIACFDHGALRVGPESAGAEPGPACYGRGGTGPTVSDANLLLGYLDPARPLGDGMRLDPAPAERAIAALAGEAGLSVRDTALGIVAVANQTMVRALRRITVERGVDGRRCALLAFGGAGPMHAAAVARAFGIARVVVPVASSIFSALGCAAAGMSYSQQRTVRMAPAEWDPGRIGSARTELRARLSAPLVAAGHGPHEIRIEEVALVRYSGQSYAVEIHDPDFADQADFGRRFRERHERLYGFATDEPWELVALRMRAFAPQRENGALGIAAAPMPGGSQSAAGACVFDRSGPVATPRHERSRLAPGQTVRGPAVIADAFSTVVVPPGATLTADRRGHLFMDVGASP